MLCLAAHFDALLFPVDVNRGALQKDEGQALAVCKFDTLDAQAYKQYGYAAHEDSDGSDGYSVDSDSDNEEVWCRRAAPRVPLPGCLHGHTQTHADANTRRHTHVRTCPFAAPSCLVTDV